MDGLFGITYPDAPQTSPDCAVAPLRPTDLDLAWGLDFHFPRGVLPLGHELVSILARSSRRAAQALPAISGRGLECRVVGPHVYTAGLPVEDAGERAERAAASAAVVSAYPKGFADLWRARAAELNQQYAHLAGLDLGGSSVGELRRHFECAVRHFARAWEIHFEVMYPMLAVVEGFRTVCRALGIEDAESAELITSGDSAIQRTDIALRGLAEQAAAGGLLPLFRGSDDLVGRLQAEPRAHAWLEAFGRFLEEHGQRSDAIVDVAARAWADDPEQPLGLIRDLLVQGVARSTAAQLREAEAARQVHRENVVARLRPADRAAFLAALARLERANFAWWNEEHNALIDLRAHLPVARVAGELAVRHGYARTDGVYLFAQEVRDIGGRGNLADTIEARRRFFEHWQPRRKDLPGTFGNPGPVNDPVMAEIVGLPPSSTDEPAGRVLHGLGCSRGVARGRARVVLTPDVLHRVETGDILVCGATSPSWTVVFPRLAGCVCDAGGPLTHAAIIAREYALPCVVGVGVATHYIKDGDLIEVDGGAGTVTLLGGGR
jgi:pyruvate,water dikinase